MDPVLEARAVLDRARENGFPLRAAMDPLAMGIAVQPVRAQNLEASRGATNFGEYFVYFSFFLVVSALLLAALFFKLSVEQRIQEVGLLRAVGLKPAEVRRLFLGEGTVLALVGAGLGEVPVLHVVLELARLGADFVRPAQAMWDSPAGARKVITETLRVLEEIAR